MLTTTQAIIIIALLSFGTIITRFLPFILFPNVKSIPLYITYLGKMLPSAAIGLLVVYCLRNVDFTIAPRGIPEAVAILAVALLHIWKKNTLLSIAAGTIIYMLLVQFMF